MIIETPDNCPACGVTWIGDPIPEEHRELYFGGETHFRREIGIELRGHDYLDYYQCPDCGATFDRNYKRCERRR